MTQEDLGELNRTRPAPTEADADATQEAPAKRIKLDETAAPDSTKAEEAQAERKRGTAPIKKEYLIPIDQSRVPNATPATADDDEAEAAPYHERENGGDGGRGGKKSKRSQQGKGQNTNRKFNKAQDEKGLCSTRQHEPEFSPKTCQFGDNCRFEHDLRKYLKEYKREDLTTFNGLCPVWDVYGLCFAGWKCRFVGSHMKERELEDGRKELCLVEDEDRKKAKKPAVEGVTEAGVVNSVATEHKAALMRKKYATPKSDAIIKWLDINYKEARQNERRNISQTDGQGTEGEAKENREENRARYTEPPLLPSEKRRVYFGPETPAVAPLTTQGNLPFRRLCVELGAQFTYSEMAMSLPLIQGHKGEWALMKAHESEALAPTLNPSANIVQGYDQARDMKFGVQIAASKPWQAVKATEVLTALCPQVRVVDLNCGCPIDLVFQSGGGSALLDSHAKLEKILRGMNTVSGEVPVTVKIRMGTKDNNPTALKLAERLILGGHEAQEQGLGPAGVAAITLHGRSRQQRYTRSADWGYIAECAALIKRLNEKTDAVTDTVREPDARYRPAAGKVFFLGNGDCYSYEDYNRAINEGGVDSVMIGRGALMKPWLFEEIQAGQYLDKSASERLTYIEKFVKYGLEAWGSDEQGVGTTRRFLLEWLSFTRRYIPIGLLEHLPPSMQDRPPAYRGRNELETLMASDNYKDWIKISEMFLGPVHKDFQFTPKHKSNSYEVEAEG